MVELMYRRMPLATVVPPHRIGMAGTSPAMTRVGLSGVETTRSLAATAIITS